MKNVYQEPTAEVIDFAAEVIMADGEMGTSGDIFDLPPVGQN